jgi:hypothetical protein
LGDARAHEVASGCISKLEEVVSDYDGRVIKHIGDEIMCVFRDPNIAINAALEMQEKVSAPADELGLTIHIGVHWGPVVVENDDLFGDAVNLAARITGLAHARQILTTSDTVELLMPELQSSTRLLYSRHVKGKKSDVDVYEVVWEQTDAATQFKRPHTQQQDMTDLRITVGALELHGGNDMPAITFGRDPGNDVVILDQTASRRHAKIDWRADKWVFTDHSSNGTLLTPDRGTPVLVLNEQILLPPAGCLRIGTPSPDSEATQVRFEQLLES